MIRLLHAPTDDELAALNDEFADLVHVGAHRGERRRCRRRWRATTSVDLPRLVLDRRQREGRAAAGPARPPQPPPVAPLVVAAHEMPSTGIASALVEELGADVVVTDPDVVDGYRYDRATTVVPGMPVAVVRARDHRRRAGRAAGRRPRTASRWCPRGRHRAVRRAPRPSTGAITLSTERMRSLADRSGRRWWPSVGPGCSTPR